MKWLACMFAQIVGLVLIVDSTGSPIVHLLPYCIGCLIFAGLAAYAARDDI